jgi:hypothetical protein
LRLNRLTGLFLCLGFWYSFGQEINVDTSDYVFPINPGNRNYLAGTMGELRGAHFHGGIDIRTGGQIGLPVYATHDGYIERIKISSAGYGHALYLKHTDGNSSLYGHLDRFNDELEKYIRDQQYENETYEIQRFPQKNQFYYKKGDLIAYSGNSGSSSGPHLHFEIRDENQRFMDPLLFGFDEIVDQMIPVAKKIAFITLDEEARVNGAFGRYEFSLIFVGNKYVTRKPISLKGKIGVEIYHYDYMDGSWARNGIPEITALINDDTIFSQQKNIMEFSLNRHILVHTNHQARLNGSSKFNKLYIDDGNELEIYKVPNSGYYFNENKEYTLDIFLRDRNNNIAQVQSIANKRKVVNREFPSRTDLHVMGNYLTWVSADSIQTLYFSGSLHNLKPAVENSGRYQYLWDVRKFYPDSIVGSSTIKTNFQVSVPSQSFFEFFNTDFDISIGKNDLFDTLYLTHEKKFSNDSSLELFEFGPRDVPIKRPVTIKLKPARKYGDEATVFEYFRGNLSFAGAKNNNDGTFTINTRSLGTYTLSSDTIPPVIIPYSWSPNNLKIKIFDEHSGIKSYRATLDGSFLLMKYDSKKDILIGIPKIENTPIKGEFKLEIEDNSGNKNQIEQKL